MSDKGSASKNLPSFIVDRINYWNELRAKQDQNVPAGPFQITLPDGSKREAKAGASPLDIAKEISQGLAQAVVVAKVNGVLWDLTRPFESDCNLELIKFDSPEGKKVFWHSSAHILGQALELKFGCKLTIGPPLKDGGFYYDMSLVDSESPDKKTVVAAEDYAEIDKLVSSIIKEKQPFERLVLSKEEAKNMFKDNKYKQELIQEKVPEGAMTSVYRCGPLIDLCKGPHLPNTGKVQAFAVWKNSSAYWKGDATRDSLQRVYGMSFPSKKEFQEWKKKIEEAEARDHRLQGKKQDLFFFHPLSPGCCFWLPRGARLYNKLHEFVRSEYRKRGYTEVVTPNMFNKDLWIQSGHWQNYQDNMFQFQVEGMDFALKPMNCPGHCLMFGHTSRSYKDLPLRFTDFGVLHRNELSGALSGLTRVRRFCQDDGHIFCRPDQIQQEIRSCLDFLSHVYKVFGFEFTLELSTRPTEKYLGEIETWNDAEAALAAELDHFKGKDGWKLNPGDGAFYGPKIDIHVYDALKREHQCATIQLDFQLPIRFNLSYVKEDGTEGRPVIIHRAIYGSLERFIAILIENNASMASPKWPFWISPRPVIVVPIDPKFNEYANKVRNFLFERNIDADVDDGKHKFNKKIAEAQVAGYNFILVVGQSEQDKNTVNVRTSDNVVHGESSLEEVLAMFQGLISEYK